MSSRLGRCALVSVGCATALAAMAAPRPMDRELDRTERLPDPQARSRGRAPASADTDPAEVRRDRRPAVALTFDHTRAESVLAAREARDAQRATLQQLRRDLEEARHRPAPEVGGREAAAVLRRAVVRRVRCR